MFETKRVSQWLHRLSIYDSIRISAHLWRHKIITANNWVSTFRCYSYVSPVRCSFCAQSWVFSERILLREESFVLFTVAKTLSCHFTNSFGVIRTTLQLNIPRGTLRYDAVYKRLPTWKWDLHRIQKVHVPTVQFCIITSCLCLVGNIHVQYTNRLTSVQWKAYI